MGHETVSRRLGVGHERLALRHGGGKHWRLNDRMEWSGVEAAALDYYRSDGWNGYAFEGGLMLNLIKAAAFCEVPDQLRATYTEAIFSGNMMEENLLPLDSLIKRVASATEQRILKNYRIMAAPRARNSMSSSMLDFFPHLREQHFIELFYNLGRERLVEIAKAFGADPYEYRKGWPDLTLWKNGEVIFREIKAPGDRLHKSQKTLIADILLPLNFDVSIVDVVDAVN